MKEIVFYDNYDVTEAYQRAKDTLLYVLDSAEQVTEHLIWDQVTQDEQEDWDILEDCVYSACAPFSGLLALGSCGSWKGSFAGSVVEDSFRDLINTVGKDCGYFKVFCTQEGARRGTLTIKCSHHDGTNMVRVKGLTAKGKEAYEEWERGTQYEELSEQKMHEKLWKSSAWSRNINVQE